MQEQSSSGGKTSYKLYAWVGVVYAPDGVMEPKYLRLSPTGEKYMIDRVYRQPLANRFLGSLADFIHSQVHIPAVRSLVVDNFRAFFRRNLVQYHRHDLPVRAIGSVAYYFREQLAFAAAKEGFAIDRVEKSPMEGLISYHNF